MTSLGFQTGQDRSPAIFGLSSPWTNSKESHKLQAMLEAEKMQTSDVLEKEKQNTTHTEHTSNHGPP